MPKEEEHQPASNDKIRAAASTQLPALPTPVPGGGPLSAANETPILLNLNRPPTVATILFLERKNNNSENKTKVRHQSVTSCRQHLSLLLKIIGAFPVLTSNPSEGSTLFGKEDTKKRIWRPGKGNRKFN